MVITSALHAAGRQFDPGRLQSKFCTLGSVALSVSDAVLSCKAVYCAAAVPMLAHLQSKAATVYVYDACAGHTSTNVGHSRLEALGVMWRLAYPINCTGPDVHYQRCLVANWPIASTAPCLIYITIDGSIGYSWTHSCPSLQT